LAVAVLFQTCLYDRQNGSPRRVLCSGSAAAELLWCTSPVLLIWLSGNACSVGQLQTLKIAYIYK